MATPWYRARWARLGGAILLFGVIGVAAIPFLVPVDRFRPLLVRLLADSTGRDVQIGVLRLYLAPAVHIHAGDLRLKNPQGFPQGDAIIVRSVDLGVAPRALLSRRLDVTYVAFRGVRLNLLQDPAGRTNFDLSPSSRGSPAGGTAARPGGGSLLTLDHVGTVSVAHVEITSSSLDARGQATPSFSLRGVSGRIGAIDLRAPNWVGAFRVTVRLGGAQLTTPALAQPVRFSTGDIVIEGPTARAAFSVSLDRIRADVTATAASADPLPIRFTAAIPELDVARLQTLVRNAPPGSRGDSGVDRRTPPRRQQLLAAGDLTVGRLIQPPFSATRLTSRLRVYTGAIHVTSYALATYGGTVQGAAAVDSSAAGSPAAITAKVSGVDLRQVTSALAPLPSPPKITGTLEAALKLSTAFGRDPMASLAGGGTFAVRNGSFPGLDVRSALAQLARALQLTVPAGPTRFSYFGGDLRISQERAYSSSLRLEAEGLDATGTGSVGFDKSLNYAGTGVLRTAPAGTPPQAGGISSAGQMLGALLPGTAGATGVQVPFSLRGTLDRPNFSLAGAPQFLHGSGSQPSQQQPQPPGQLVPNLPDLFKLLQ